MLQSFLLIDEFTDRRAADRQPSSPSWQRPNGTSPDDVRPQAILRQFGFRFHEAANAEEAVIAAGQADAAILSVAPAGLPGWRSCISAAKKLPILWWCDRHTFPGEQCKLDMEIDGMLSPSMCAADFHCALLLASGRFFQRIEWQQEREQLSAKLEERKWIDQAKGILCEIKRISEAEAYEFLRKQAMNERKRMVDVATSIVKVYQLLQNQHKGGRRG